MASAHYMLANIYMFGLGEGKADYMKGMEYLCQAIEKKNMDAEYSLFRLQEKMPNLSCENDGYGVLIHEEL